MSDDDAWIAGMVREGERRATEEMAARSQRFLDLLPEMYHASAQALIAAAIATGQQAAFNVLNEQGWIHPEMERS